MRNTKVTKLMPIIALSGALAIAGFVFKQDDPFASVSVTKTYTSRDFGPLELMGACSITPDTVSCWDTDAKPSPDLTEKVKAYYIVQNTANLQYRFGRKNRLIVFKAPANNGPATVYLGNPTGPNGSYVTSAGQLNNNNSGPYLVWYAMDAEPEATTCSLNFSLNITVGSGSLPLKEGAEAKVGPVSVRISSIKAGPDRPIWNGTNQKQKTWSVSIVSTALPGGIFPPINANAMSKDGVYVYNVDQNGSPVPQNPGFGFRRQVLNGQIQVVSGAGTANEVLSLPVNPIKVGSLQLTASGTRKITFTDIPLDPKS